MDSQAQSTHQLKQIKLKSDGWDKIFTEVGQLFPGGAKSFRYALRQYSINTGHDYKFLKNDTKRVTAVCPVEDCKWRVHGLAPLNCDSMFILKDLEMKHDCADFIKKAKKPKINSSFVGKLILDDVSRSPDRSTKSLKNDFLKDYGVQLPYYYTYEGKKVAMNEAFGQEGDSYAKLKWYADAFSRTNPNSIVQLEIDDATRRFQRIFIAPHACMAGFKYCRPVIYVDGTFCKTRFNGCILSAVAKDGNNGLFPFAYAVVDAENDINWEWFLGHLRNAVDMEKTYTFISDRHNGIINGVKKIFPTANHSFCVWHLRNNLNLRLANGARKSKFFQSLIFKAARAIPESEYNNTINQMIQMGGSKVAAFFQSLDPASWADAFFPGPRYTAITSQLSESFNNQIKYARVLPITAMLDAIRTHIMNKMNVARALSNKWTTFLCPTITDLLKSKHDSAATWNYAQAAPLIFEVYSDPSHSVDLLNLTCTCRRWQVDMVPCEHAMLCIKTLDEDQQDCFYDPIWTTESYVKTYQEHIMPIPNYDEPRSFDEDTKTLPPLIRRRPGRPRTVRIESSGNIPRKLRICGRCKQPSYHNRSTCRVNI